jgi:acid phosphatase
MYHTDCIRAAAVVLIGAVLGAQEAASRPGASPASPPLRRIAARVIGSRPAPAFTMPSDRPDPDDLCFAAFGDQGTAGAGQRKVAAALERWAPLGPIDLVLLLGDNFYPLGVISVDDPQWRAKFEDVYAPDKLAVPFYACLGNHDHYGTAQAQVDYSTRADTRWRMPAAYYSFTEQAQGRKVRFIALDTQPMHRAKTADDMREQYEWLDAELGKPGADWKIVFGHHPLLGNGPSGRARAPMSRLVPLLEKHGVDVYFAGHDHTLEWVGPVNGVTYVISGAGGGADNPYSMTWRDDTVFAHTGGGLCLARCSGEALELSFRDPDGRVLFARTLARKLPGDAAK